MRGDLTLSLGTLYGFLLVLTRVAGAFVFVPLPGVRSGPAIARAVLSVSITFTLVPQWPAYDLTSLGLGRLAGGIVEEAALGIGVGLAVSFLVEAFVLAAQFMGLQAGYAYASTIDPTTQADSGILLILSQLLAGLLFFAAGLDREVIRIFARSLEAHPPLTFMLTRPVAEGIVLLGSQMFAIGLRLALPVLALMVLIDVALALLGRINAQLQLLMMALPAKMLVSLGLLAWLAVLFPTIFRTSAGRMLGVVQEAFAK